jgi:hypothetical protein
MSHSKKIGYSISKIPIPQMKGNKRDLRKKSELVIKK